jgi:arylsulfatase A-like enzyme
MDETYDRIRAVRDRRFKYIRNFHPELPYAQRIAYMDQMPAMQAWRRLHDEGKLTGPRSLFFAPAKPADELYDLEADPHEVDNLADAPEHAAKLKELREALQRWMDETGDLGAESETELIRRGLVADVLTEYERRRPPVRD